MKKLNIQQKDGVVYIYEGDELQTTISLTRKDKMSEVALANMVAELIHDCLNCKNVKAELHDLNDTKSYYGTYFEYLN